MPSARLWIVATPIGNYDDLSPRGRSILQEADIILAEDTRRAGMLLNRIGLSPKKLLSFFEHNEAERLPEVIAALEEGKTVALVTDAGTPLVSDPGYRLVRQCRERNLPVSPVPGPSALLAALSASGLPPVPFSFLGFLPRSIPDRKQVFRTYATLPGSLIFFERKNRLSESLAIAFEALGQREVAICRELTKIHEQFIHGRLENGKQLAEGLIGELTIIIGPPEGALRLPVNDARKLLLQALASGLKPKHAAKMVKASATGWTTAELYELIQSLRQI